MTAINTLGGVTDSGSLGITYMHEHVFVKDPALQHYWPGYQGWDEDEQVEKARAALTRLHDVYGVDTIVDPTVPGLGRDVRAVARAAEGTGLTVIVATGWYLHTGLPLPFVFKDLDGKIAELERLFVRDVEEGLEGTSVKPGVIKCLTSHTDLSQDVEAVLRAAARTHVRTGLPITTHSDPVAKSGLVQQRVFREEGVDLGAVVIGHCNDAEDIGYLEELIGAGSILGFDKCGTESPQLPQARQLDTLAELCRRGYSERIVLSHDRMVYQDLLPPTVIEAVWNAELGDPYGHIQAQTLPGLRARGVTEAQIGDVLETAPRRFFERSGVAA